MEQLIKGMDLSTLMEVEACGGKFYDAGQQMDAVEILKNYGMNLVRLRLWNDPYSEDGVPYGAGTNDLPRTIAMAKRLRSAGIDWMLDLHYSDFWADPGKQTIPKAWKGLQPEDLARAVYDFTVSTLNRLSAEGVLPSIVAVGNELTNGLLWPHGRVPNFENITLFLNAGIRAVHNAVPGAKTMIHLDNGGNNELYRSWFDSYFAHGGMDFDYIGLSYYPFWHGSMDDLKNNMHDLACRYGKDLIIAEVSTGFTLEDYAQYEQLEPSMRKGMATKPALTEKVPYDMSPEGQSVFMRDIMETIRGVPGGKGKGFVYWEPAWIPVPGCGWANDAALAYTGEKGPGGNEWANQALFDYDGNALSALKTIRDFPGGTL
ncbi:MAG: glycosyl hydrolase 53 family protein [Eubacteriales bacterium]|nr:glycosyl hydrolase 53 family protein [Eubacteriales bacterium]